MGLRFTVHASGIAGLAQALAAASTRAEHAVANQVAKDTAPFVPARTGSLTRQTRVAGSTVIYPGPYARFLYHGKVMIDPTTGSAFAREGATKVVTPRDLVFSKAMHPQAQAQWFEASKAVNRQKWIRVADKAVKKFGKR